MKENYSSLLVLLVLALNFGLSWWNARASGLMWSETKKIGGWYRFMNWMGAIMSASGFTWCYLIVLIFGTYYMQPYFLDPDQPLILTEEGVKAGFSLGYLIIIPGVLFAGLMIWIDSLVRAWINRSATNIGIAGWNTFAQVHNTYRAMRGMPEAFKSVTGFFKGGNSKDKGALLILALLVVAILAGVLTTWAIINKYAGSRDLPGVTHEEISKKSSFQERLERAAVKK